MFIVRGALRTGVATYAFALGAISVPPVHAQVRLALPAVALADALNALSRAARIEILADPALLRGRKAPAIRDAATPEAALNILLHGSGLVFEGHGNAFLILRDAPARQRGSARTARPANAGSQMPQRVARPAPDVEPPCPVSIVVTGSHIARPELESAMPISIIGFATAENYGRDNAYDALMLNPAIGPGLGDSNSQGQEYDVGVANINLRNMGNNRSLVLVNGQRWVSGGARTSAVDLNTIPSVMIDRFEVVTGGATAVYGADAVTGAVNIIMKKDITGLHISATNGISGHGDANQSHASLATGFKFGGGRGHFVIGGDYTHTAPLRWANRYDRRISYHANPGNTGPHDGIPDNILSTNYGSIYRSAVPAFYINNQWYQYQNGMVVPVGFNVVATPGVTGTGDGGPVVTALENHLLRNLSERGSLYAHLSYEVTSAISWNVTFNDAHSYTRAVPEWPEVRTDARPANWWGGTTGEVATLTNPYLPDAIRQFMIARQLTELPLDRSYFNLPEAWEIHNRDAVTLGTDIGGILMGKLSWSAFVRYGQVIDHIVTTNMVGKNEWLYARDTIQNPVTGAIECADPTARAHGCQPLNFFSTAPYNPALLAYIENSRFEWTKNALLNAGANLDGELFRLPDGAVKIAGGFEWRRETLHTRDDPDTAKLADIVFSPGEDYALHPALDAARSTAELYGEMAAPLLRDRRFARRLAIEAAYRFSHYSDNPDTSTWKAGGSWEPVRGLTLRGVYSHSIRVPNFGELYVPISHVTYGHISDPCAGNYITLDVNRRANCQMLMPGLPMPLPYPNPNAPVVYSGGNPKLTPETSNSYTLGLVFQPKFLPGFDLTADYWDIKIDHVITALSYDAILDGCVDSPGGPNQAYCQFVTRNPDGTVDYIQAQYANLAGQHARGVDIGMSYRHRLGEGLFRARFSGTYLLEQTTIAEVGQLGTDYAGQWEYPRFRATLVTDYTIGRVTIGINTRFISRSLYSATAPSPETYQFPHVPAYVYNDVTLNYRATSKYMLSFGVKNISNVGVFGPLQDTAPGPHGSGGDQTGAAYYDAIGRYFFVKVDIDI